MESTEDTAFPKSFNGLFWDLPCLYEGPPLTDAMVERAQRALGYRLPAKYIGVLRVQNGGYLVRSCYPSTQLTLFGGYYFSCPLLMGLGAENGIDSLHEGMTRNQRLIRSWAYPTSCVVFCHYGHGGFLFDYRDCGPNGEPGILYANAEGAITQIYSVAPSFADFFANLKPARFYRKRY